MSIWYLVLFWRVQQNWRGSAVSCSTAVTVCQDCKRQSCYQVQLYIITPMSFVSLFSQLSVHVIILMYVYVVSFLKEGMLNLLQAALYSSLWTQGIVTCALSFNLVTTHELDTRMHMPHLLLHLHDLSVTLVEWSYQTTWSLTSDQWPWWCLIQTWLQRCPSLSMASQLHLPWPSNSAGSMKWSSHKSHSR